MYYINNHKHSQKLYMCCVTILLTRQTKYFMKIKSQTSMHKKLISFQDFKQSANIIGIFMFMHIIICTYNTCIYNIIITNV